MVDIPYIWNLKRNDTNELSYKTEILTGLEPNFWLWQWEGWMVGEFGMDTYTLLDLRWMTNKDLLYRTGSSAQCYVAAWKGVGFEGERIDVYICMAESLLCSPETHNIVNPLISIQNKKLKQKQKHD